VQDAMPAIAAGSSSAATDGGSAVTADHVQPEAPAEDFVASSSTATLSSGTVSGNVFSVASFLTSTPESTFSLPLSSQSFTLPPFGGFTTTVFNPAGDSHADAGQPPSISVMNASKPTLGAPDTGSMFTASMTASAPALVNTMATSSFVFTAFTGSIAETTSPAAVVQDRSAITSSITDAPIAAGVSLSPVPQATADSELRSESTEDFVDVSHLRAEESVDSVDGQDAADVGSRTDESWGMIDEQAARATTPLADSRLQPVDGSDPVTLGVLPLRELYVHPFVCYNQTAVLVSMLLQDMLITGRMSMLRVCRPRPIKNCSDSSPVSPSTRSLLPQASTQRRIPTNHCVREHTVAVWQHLLCCHRQQIDPPHLTLHRLLGLHHRSLALGIVWLAHR